VGADKFTIEKEQWLVCLPEDLRIPLPRPELPMLVLNTLAAISVGFITPPPPTPCGPPSLCVQLGKCMSNYNPQA